jgi:hypothetical protein
MARMVANDEYGIALLADAHQPKQALVAFDREIALLPASTVKPDSLQWAVAFWHRATAYQQLGQWAHAEGDLATAEDTLTKAIAAASGDVPRPSILPNCASGSAPSTRTVLEHLGKHSEAQRVLSYTIVLLSGGAESGHTALRIRHNQSIPISPCPERGIMRVCICCCVALLMIAGQQSSICQQTTGEPPAPAAKPGEPAASATEP